MTHGIGWLYPEDGGQQVAISLIHSAQNHNGIITWLRKMDNCELKLVFEANTACDLAMGKCD